MLKRVAKCFCGNGSEMHSFLVFWVNTVCERLLALVIVFFCTGKRMKRIRLFSKNKS